MFELGDKLKDTVTGFEGIATQKVEMLNGCIQYFLQPAHKKTDKEVPKGEWIDDQQLKRIGNGINRKVSGTGGGVVQPGIGPKGL